MHACKRLCLEDSMEEKKKHDLFHTPSDTDTYLFVHLNVEPIGHLIILQNRSRNLIKKTKLKFQNHNRLSQILKTGDYP